MSDPKKLSRARAEADVSDDMTALEPCPRCDGAGQVESMIEGRLYFSCPACGGHKAMPAVASGPWWFYLPMSPQRGYLSQRIASVVAEPDGRWRTTYYGPDGPHRHEFEKREVAFGQLHGYERTGVAARLLDNWSTKEVWALGLKRLAYSQYSNLFVRIPYASDALYLRAKNRGVGGDLDKLLAVCREVHREFCPDEELW